MKVGDNVRLKSSGPLMTVDRLYDLNGPRAECKWFVANEACVFECDFAVEALEVVDE